MLDIDLVTVTSDTEDILKWKVTADFIRCSCLFFDSLSAKGEEYQHKLLSLIESIDKSEIIENHILPRYGTHISQHSLNVNHFTVKFTLTNLKKAVVILKMHGHLHNDEKSVFLKEDDELYTTHFHIDADSLDSQQLTNIQQCRGAYLMIDTTRNAIIRSGSTCTSFKQRYKEHTRSSKLRTSESKESRLYCRYPHEEANIDDGTKG